MKNETIGNYLKNSRISKNITIEMVSQKTEITSTQLENLETNRFDLMPNMTYVKGYLKSYGKLLEEEEETLLKLLEKTYQPSKIENLNNLTPYQKTKPNIPIFLIGGIIALGLGISGFFYFYNSTEIKTKKVKIVTPQEITAETPLKIQIIPKKPEIKVEPVVVPSPIIETASKKEEITLYEIKNELYTYEKNDVDKIINDYLPKKFQKSVVTGIQNVFINAVEDDTWITYKVDSSPIKKFILKKGRSLFINGEVIRVFLGKVTATKIFLNNLPLKIVSRTGVKSLIFPKERKSEFRIPLFIFQNDGKVITSEEYMKTN